MRYRKLDEDYKNSVIDYEAKIESLTNEVNLKSSQIEDLHLRIKAAQEEYEEIIMKRIKDNLKIKELEEAIFIIKKDNDIKNENLLLELKEHKEALSLRDNLVRENSLLNEKYEKAFMELNKCKEAFEQLEHNSEKYLRTIEKLTEELENKEKLINILNIHKKEIENELIKQAEIYGFSLDKNIFRRQSVSDIDNQSFKMLERKPSLATADDKRVSWIFHRRINEDENREPWHSDKDLHSICEDRDDIDDKLNYESNNNYAMYYVEKPDGEVSNTNENEFVAKEDANTRLNNNILDTSIEKDENINKTPIAIDKNSDKVNDNNYDNNDYSNSPEKYLCLDNNINSAPPTFSAADFISKNNNSTIQEFTVGENDNHKSNSEFNRNTVAPSQGLKRSFAYRSSNYLINRRISLRDLIDSNLEEFDENHSTRRQSIMNFIGNTAHNNVIADQRESRQLEKEQNQLELNANSDKNNLEISYYSIEIANKALNFKLEESEQRYSTNFTEVSELIVNDLKAKVEDLMIKNVELQSILANEKFEKESEIKLKQMKIDKLSAALLELKKKVQGK